MNPVIWLYVLVAVCLVVWMLWMVYVAVWNKKSREPQPPAPCGNDKEHYYWIGIGWSCPVCLGKRQRAEQLAKEERDLDRLASKIASRLNSSR